MNDVLNEVSDYYFKVPFDQLTNPEQIIFCYRQALSGVIQIVTDLVPV